LKEVSETLCLFHQPMVQPMTTQIQTAIIRGSSMGKTVLIPALPGVPPLVVRGALPPQALEHIRQLLPMARRAGQILRRHLA
jgi:hypothetical protein